MIYKGKKYGIIPTILVLKHEAMEEEGPDVNGDLVQFTYQSGQKFDPTNAGQGHCFLPLGYLTEFSTKEKSGRLTNYVWAINVTTDPKSLWLIYDYVTQDEMGDEMIANLSTVYMNVHNILNARKYTHQKLPSSKRPPTTRGYLGFEKRWDVIRVFANVDHWQPDDPGRYEPELDMAEELGNGLRAIPTYTSRHPY